MRKTAFIIIFALLGLLSMAQEVLIDIAPPDLFGGKFLPKTSLKSSLIDTLELPFFDDFASSKVYPHSDYWLDKGAYINNGYAINPLSIGVASLDAIDSVGAIYAYLSWQVSDVSEYLTSKPINLDFEISDSIYLSFYYQCGGYGEMPEEGDSLILEFNSPDTVWHSVWSTPGEIRTDTFFLASIPITEEFLLKKGFQFRFKNLASLSSNYEPAYKGNADIWNIDYVYVDTARNANDTIVEDVAFISNFESIVKDYESVPWEHFKPYAAENTLDTIRFVYKNNGTNVQNINRQIQVSNEYQGGLTFSNLDDNENIGAFSTLRYTKYLTGFAFDNAGEDSAKFVIKGFIKTDTTIARRPYRWNDTIEYNQYFGNYYAYDDGSAERGYGIGGQGTSGASLAYSFTPLKPDTIRGVNIFYNQVLDGNNINYFFLTMWEDNNGIPGDTIMQQIGVRPIYSDSINEFCYYELDRPLFVDSKFYIGWVKTTDDMLNVGYDLNRDAGEHLYYNTQGYWQQSMYSGAPMIRPVFGKKELAISVAEYDSDKVTMYPNPVSDILNIDTQTNTVFEYTVLDFNGRVLRQGTSTGTILFTDFSDGMYFVKIDNNGKYTTNRVVVSR